MMRRLFAAVALVFAALIVTAAPSVDAGPAPTAVVDAVDTSTAPTHQYDNYSTWYCAWSRPSSSYTVVHSVPDYLTPTHVRYYCGAVVGTIAYQWWVWRDLASGGWMYGSVIMDCRYYACHEPG